MSCSQTLRRNQEAIEFAQDSTKVGKLQRNYNYSFMWLFLEVNYTAAASAGLKYGHFANLIRTISITGNGNTEFKNLDFSSLLFYTWLQNKGKQIADFPNITQGDHTYTLPVLLPFESLTMNYISDTGLLSNIFQTLDLQVNWTNASAVGSNITINSARLRPVSFEKIMNTNASGNLDKVPYRLIQKTQTEQISTSSEGILINIPPLKWYNSIQFDVLNGSDGSAVVGAIKRVKFLQGTDILADINVEDLQVDNQRRYDVDTMAFKTAYSTQITANQTINPSAHFMLDFSTDGDYSNSTVTSKFTMPQISIDTSLPTGVNSIKVRLNCNYVEAI